jgi:tetratricopeptide (TPR) repeat protein
VRRCSDKKFRDAIHSYELGLLEGAELTEFEKHLLDCEYCFNEVQKFHQVSDHLIKSPLIARAVKDFVINTDNSTSSEIPKQQMIYGNNFWKTLIPVAAIMIVFLLIKPWKIGFFTSEEAIAAENRLLITCFDNLSGDTSEHRLGEIIADLLRADLAESQNIQIISDQYMFDQLMAMGVEQECPLDKAISSRLAEKSQAKWLLSGTIIQVHPTMVINSQLIDISSGIIMASQEVSADTSESLFTLVDMLSIKILKDLKLPQSSSIQSELNLSEVATYSVEAYNHYLNGIQNLNKLYYTEAITSFKKALGYDSTFAMVYYYLSDLENPELIYSALKYSKSISHIDKLYIQCKIALHESNISQAIQTAIQITNLYPLEKRAYYILGNCYFNMRNHSLAIEYYSMVTEIDPLNCISYNQMAYCYAHTGDYQNAYRVLDKYITIASDEPNPYDTQGEILACDGKLQQAITSLEKALQINPTFNESRFKLGVMKILNNEYIAAEKCFSVTGETSNSVQKMRSQLYIACINARRGLFDKAMTAIDSILKNNDSSQAVYPIKILAGTLKTSILNEIGDSETAIELMEKTYKIGDKYYPNLSAGFSPYYIMLLCEYGKIDIAKELYNGLSLHVLQNRIQRSCQLAGKGYLEYSQNNYNEAGNIFKQISSVKIFPLDNNFYEYHYMLALSSLKTGMYKRAINEFEMVHNSYTYQRILWSVWDIKAYYYLGIAHEQLGNVEKAIHNFDMFLDHWKKADHLNSIGDARKRLAELKLQSAN